MPEHYTKSTISATFRCNKCGKDTLHRIDDGRRGPCYTCMEAPLAKPEPPQEDTQLDLWGEPL